MSEFLPPNLTLAEYALAKTIARVSAVPTPLRELWNPDTCPSALLPWLAWTLNVDAWDSTWPDSYKRSIIAQSVYIHRHKGTVGAISALVDALGVEYTLSEWWQTTLGTDSGLGIVTDSGASLDVLPEAAPYTANITFAATNVLVSVQQSLINAINNVKPARALITITNTSGFDGSPNVCGVASVTVFNRFEFSQTYRPNAGAEISTDSGNTIVTDSGVNITA